MQEQREDPPGVVAIPIDALVTWSAGSFWGRLSDRMVVYLFPVFLLGLGALMGILLDVDAPGFIGPSLAATGAGFAIMAFSHRSWKGIARVLRSNGMNHIVAKEILKDSGSGDIWLETGLSKIFRNGCLVLAFGMTAVWAMSIIFVEKQPNVIAWMFRVHYLPGGACYVVGLALSEMKELV